ncbi:MAG: hypothetical protein LBR10_02665 [Prevotellaceae bacterium]|jgi:cyclic pyranopterin phosphate synthase|nr:hypothetical protein [Prevotellaceae bacterium]
MKNIQKIENVVKISNSYKLALNNNNLTASLAGLEPTLWRDGKYDIFSLIAELKTNNTFVDITTNGSALLPFSDKFIGSGLSKCRVSVHSFDQKTYSRITGKNNLNNVLEGITRCSQNNLTMVINRVLLKGFTDDIPKGLEFIQKTNINLKLYDLWWVKRIDENYSKYYIHWQDIVSKYITENTSHTEVKYVNFHRNRIIFHLKNGGSVDVKQFNAEQHQRINKCKNCVFNNKCKETFASYIHVFPNGHLTFCNLREDIHLDLKPMLDKNISETELSNYLKSRFNEVIGSDWQKRLKETDLRFYINEACNYKCSFPNSEGYGSLWCLSSIRTNESWNTINNFEEEKTANNII